MGFSYDLHIHSCLSPCGDDDMTPPNIANMAALLGLDLIAVTDHNSCRNAGAVMEAARMLGLPLRVLPGMEVTTAEEVHVVCLFPELAAAQAAGEEVEAALLPVKNKPDIFGRQLILGDAARPVKFGGSRQIRVIFDGRESAEPVISNLVLACKVPVNIMYAQTRDVGGTAMGQMILQLPEDETEASRALHYLETVKIPYEEVDEHDI